MYIEEVLIFFKSIRKWGLRFIVLYRDIENSISVAPNRAVFHRCIWQGAFIQVAFRQVSADKGPR
eukprot:11433606-Prorocentrum_lima.AAC.1